MTEKLQRALEEQKQQTSQYIPPVAGLLGIPLGGQKRVEVAGRNGYVHVRLRSNQSETIQAYNNTVATSYNLPVWVERKGNKYVVTGYDDTRYENNQASQSPFLPRHGNTHSFDTESGGGGDVVWVYPRQITPLLVMPSGSSGAGNVIVNPYLLKGVDNSWKYVGNTGTASITQYNPTSPTGAIIALVGLDANTGNPFLIINSGTVFSNSVTGSSRIAPYIPLVTGSNQIPLAAIRLITGTSRLSWDNIYDLRQFVHPTPTGTGGGSSGNLDSTYLRLDTANSPLTGALRINHSGGTGTSVIETLTIHRNGTGAGRPFDKPVILIQDDFDPSKASHTSGGLLKFYDSLNELLVHFNPYASGTVDAYIFDTTNYVSPLGTLLSVRNQGNVMFSVNGAGTPNIPVGTTYNINGSPHSHGEVITNANDIFNYTAGVASAWAGTIASLPGGAPTTITITTTSGNKNALTPTSTTLLGKMRMYNTARGTSALITNFVAGTNTVTFTANVPAGWTVGDTVTIASQTVSGGGLSWVDIEIISGELLNKTKGDIYTTHQSATVGDLMRIHPFDASFSTAKYFPPADTEVAGIAHSMSGAISPISNLFALAWTGTPTLVRVRQTATRE